MSDEILEPMEPMEPVEPAETRSIEELLKLRTYQGMTDEEIQLILDYRVQIALDNAATNAQVQAVQETYANIANEHLAFSEHAKAVFDSIVQSNQNLQVISYE